MRHKCEIENEELEMILECSEGSIWIHNFLGEFMWDFDVNFCPKCGNDLRLANER